jgi:hypothetical protein
VFQIPPDWVPIDEDGPSAAPVTAGLGLPAHFAISHRRKGTIKRFGRIPGGLRRAVRPLGDDIELDLLGNPDYKLCWCKLWDDDGYDVISDTEGVPEWPASVVALWAARKSHASRGPSSSPGGAPSTFSSSDLMPTEHYLAKGIKPGQRDDTFTRLALREVRKTGAGEAALATLLEIGEKTEPDEHGDWTERRLRPKIASAVRLIAGEHEAGEGEREELARARQKVIEAFTGENPGHSFSAHFGERSSCSAQNFPDLGELTAKWMCPTLRSPEEFRRKRRDERNDHALSVDWVGHATEHDEYDALMYRAEQGENILRGEISDACWGFLSITHPNGAVLAGIESADRVCFYGDPAFDLGDDDDDERAEVMGPYPGTPDGVNPVAGRQLRELGIQAVWWCWKDNLGKRMSDRQVAQWINKRHDELGLAGHRYLHISTARQNRKILVERGRLVQRLEEERYRKMHAWRTLSAAYEAVEPEGMTPQEAAEFFAALDLSAFTKIPELEPA